MATPAWRPSEIIINNKVKDDPITLHFLSQCPNVPVKYVADSTANTVKAASDVLRETPEGMLNQIQAGKRVVHISPVGANILDPFEMEDQRMMCPEFDRVKFASNGCYYNCDWCFLKATYRANQNFINVHVEYDKFKKEIERHIKKANRPVMFDSGELADSLAMEHLTKAGQEFIPWFGKQTNGYLYMLTKSDNVDSLLRLEHNKHTIIAWSINADIVSRLYEVGAPLLKDRISAAKKVQQAGYPIRLRLDPIIPVTNWKQYYAGAIKRVFADLKPERITLGTLRFEENLYNMRDTIFSNSELKKLAATLKPMLPETTLPDGKKSIGKYSFSKEQRIELFKFAIDEIRKYSPDITIALCKETEDVWKELNLDLKECKCVCQLDSADMTGRANKEVITVTKDKKTGKAAAKKSGKKVGKKEAAPKVVQPTVPLLPEEKYEPHKLYDLDITYLAPDPNQPRKSIDETELKELTASIKKHGVLQPVLFRKTTEGMHIIVSGERRYQASLLANQETIPAIYTEGNAAEIALVENLLRVDLTAIEEAEALQRLKTDARYSNKELAAVIGKAESTISEILKLNELPEKLRNNYRTDKTLSRRRLLEVAKAPDVQEMKKQFKKLLNETSRDELRTSREPRHRELDTIFKTMIGGLKTKLNEVDFDAIDDEKKTTIQTELQELADLIGEKLG